MIDQKTGKAFPRGGKPTPRHKLLSCHPHVATAAPAQFAIVPKQLSMWGNSQYGDCVSAEEAFAIACYSLMLGLPQAFVTEQTVIAWAQRGGFLNGADLTEVMDSMKKKGMTIGSQLYDDGGYSGVDYSNEAVLQSAISVGPVKIAIDANALPNDAGNVQGWFAIGGRPGQFPNTDHCTGLSGYGPAEWLYQQLGVPMPSQLAGKKGYLHFTWSTIGFVDHDWIMSTVVEAWVRNPTNIGVPPFVLPTPPAPTPVPPSPTPTPVPGGGIPFETPLVLHANGTFTLGGGGSVTVDMSKLPALIDAFNAFLMIPPVPPAFHVELANRTAGMGPQAINFAKLIQIALMLFAWYSTGANPVTLPALIQSIIAIITGP